MEESMDEEFKELSIERESTNEVSIFLTEEDESRPTFRSNSETSNMTKDKEIVARLSIPKFGNRINS